MVINNVHKGLLAGVILLQPVQIRPDNMETVKTIGIIGGAVAAGCGLIAGINYLCTPSNETLISRGCDIQSRVYTRYDSLMRYCQSRNFLLYESDLSHIAGSYMRGSSIEIYKREMRDILNELAQARRNLNDRMDKLARKGERYTAECRGMERIEATLAQLEPVMQKTCESIAAYSAYFDLHFYEHEVARIYGSLVDIVDRYGSGVSNHVYFSQQLREIIAVQGISHRNPYPTITYVETLTDTMSKLEKVMCRCSYNCDLLVRATALYTKLSYARSVLLADDRYVYEIQERERARREEERLRIERQRLEAERAKADAAQRQAYEAARQNEILREQNRIERERNECHRFCDRYQCCCNKTSECPTIRINVVR